MFRNELNHMNLEKEFKKLGLGLNQSFKSSFNIFKIFLRKSLKRLEMSFSYLLDPPKIYRSIEPGKWEEVPKRLEHSHHHHPPNLR